jgi:hypothetical protein
LENEFFLRVDVKGAEFQGSRIILVVEGTQAGGVEVTVENPISFALVE